MLSQTLVLLLSLVHISTSYKTNPTPYICLESDSKSSTNLPSCLPGYVIDIENVMFESTIDQTCTGIARCQVKNANALMFACNRKRTCNVRIDDLHFTINATCGSAMRLYTTYRCLPVIHDQADTMCESPTARRVTLGDINLSCERNYHLFVRKASVGISLRQQAEASATRFKCNRDTPTTCVSPVQNAYRDVCDTQLGQSRGAECKIRYQDRPPLNECPYGPTSNFSTVEYSCIPGMGVKDDLPRIDICSTETPTQRLTTDRGLLHSPNYPQVADGELTCRKDLHVPQHSRVRLFMLEKSLSPPQEFNIYTSNNARALAANELFDVNITKRNGEVVRFELNSNQVAGALFVLYFQVDGPQSAYAPMLLEPGREKALWNRTWVIAIACFLLLLLLIVAAVFAYIRVSRRRRARSRRYLKGDDDQRARLSTPKTSPDEHRHAHRNVAVEQPYLVSSPPSLFPATSANGHARPQSASSTASSIIMHQANDGPSDRESLIKPAGQPQPHPNADIDNFYEEIKEQQHQTALALGLNTNKGSRSSQPIGDHHENYAHYKHPRASDEPIDRSHKPLPPIPTPASTDNPTD